MHEHDLPAIRGVLADGGTVSAQMLLGRVYAQIVVIPESVAEELDFVSLHLQFDCWSKAQITVFEVLNGLIAAVQLSRAGIKSNVAVKALLKTGSVTGIEGRAAVGHTSFHVLIFATNIDRPCIHKSYMVAQINRKAEFLDEIYAKNSFERVAAGFANTLQVDGRKPDVVDCMFPHR